ncbi:unnamed protein product [Arctogadus glacialis]
MLLGRLRTSLWNLIIRAQLASKSNARFKDVSRHRRGPFEDGFYFTKQFDNKGRGIHGVISCGAPVEEWSLMYRSPGSVEREPHACMGAMYRAESRGGEP